MLLALAVAASVAVPQPQDAQTMKEGEAFAVRGEKAGRGGGFESGASAARTIRATAQKTSLYELGKTVAKSMLKEGAETGGGQCRKSEPCNSAGKLYVFISFSMPEASLRSLIEGANEHGAICVLRGLKNNSMQETALEVRKYKGSVDINPPLFTQYKIDRVPVFVLVKEDGSVQSLAGNVTYDFALGKLGRG